MININIITGRYSVNNQDLDEMDLPTPEEIKMWSTPKLEDNSSCQDELRNIIMKAKSNIDEILR